jgi:hypothetical protein
LHAASEAGQLDIVNMLLVAGKSELLFKTDHRGNTCLHYACRAENLQVIKCLVEAGGPELLYSTSRCGLTCLHSAAHHGLHSVVTYLTTVGGKDLASLPIQSCRMAGMTAMELARGDGLIGTTCSCSNNDSRPAIVEELSSFQGQRPAFKKFKKKFKRVLRGLAAGSRP